jgi:hypothetical protein
MGRAEAWGAAAAELGLTVAEQTRILKHAKTLSGIVDGHTVNVFDHTVGGSEGGSSHHTGIRVLFQREIGPPGLRLRLSRSNASRINRWLGWQTFKGMPRLANDPDRPSGARNRWKVLAKGDDPDLLGFWMTDDRIRALRDIPRKAVWVIELNRSFMATAFKKEPTGEAIVSEAHRLISVAKRLV